MGAVIAAGASRDILIRTPARGATDLSAELAASIHMCPGCVAARKVRAPCAIRGPERTSSWIRNKGQGQADRCARWRTR